jgi:hypothetical protein
MALRFLTILTGRNGTLKKPARRDAALPQKPMVPFR